MALADKACTTCRKKCRKCDRTQPTCRRCASKGLECGGYPDKFKFVGIASRGKWKGLEKPLPKDELALGLGRPHLQESTSTLHTPELIQDSRAYSDSAPSDYLETPPTEEEEVAMIGMEDDDEFNIPRLPDVDIPETSIEELLRSRRTEHLLSYYDHYICPKLSIELDGTKNPFREYVLPLVYEHLGLLHAVLGLAACHLSRSPADDAHLCKTEALKHRLEAKRHLKDLLAAEAKHILPRSYRDVILAITHTVTLVDVCDSGIVRNGKHFDEVAHLLERLFIEHRTVGITSKRTIFLLESLAWFDLMRGVCGVENLAFSQDDRRKVIDASGPEFELMTGCHKSLFLIMGDVISHDIMHSKGEIPRSTLERILGRTERELLAWNENTALYPSTDLDWRIISDMHRHAFLLRVLSSRHRSHRSAELPIIQESVTKVLDAASEIPSSNSKSKTLLLPLFFAGMDAVSGHQKHYVTMRTREIMSQTSFSTLALTILDNVWATRAAQPKGDHSHIPWIDMKCVHYSLFQGD